MFCREFRANVPSPPEAVFHKLALRALVDVHGDEVNPQRVKPCKISCQSSHMR